MSKTTQATLALAQAKIAFTPHIYDYDAKAAHIGMAAAEAVGFSPDRVLKTLMVVVDGKPACCVIPSDRELSMKKVAAAFAGKSAEMMKPAEAEKVTGFKVGGISPFGQRRRVPIAIADSALGFETVLINGGQRGMLVELKPEDAMRVAHAAPAELTA
ncbi:MAG: Cys-tRNA(Pro) deacylase [Alphaproteobacteria bacterium]|nr:Cys-tRNA(Pro) deacylase [Alphaproteobacteria bacterium]